MNGSLSEWFLFFQRDGETCPAFPSAFACSSETPGPPGPQGPPVSPTSSSLGVTINFCCHWFRWSSLSMSLTSAFKKPDPPTALHRHVTQRTGFLRFPLWLSGSPSQYSQSLCIVACFALWEGPSICGQMLTSVRKSRVSPVFLME